MDIVLTEKKEIFDKTSERSHSVVYIYLDAKQPRTTVHANSVQVEFVDNKVFLDAKLEPAAFRQLTAIEDEILSRGVVAPDHRFVSALNRTTGRAKLKLTNSYSRSDFHIFERGNPIPLKHVRGALLPPGREMKLLVVWEQLWFKRQEVGISWKVLQVLIEPPKSLPYDLGPASEDED